MGPHLKDVKRLKLDLSKRYEITDLGEISSYLGICITCDRPKRRLDIDQSGYIKDLLDRFNMADANPCKTLLPAGADVHLIKNTGKVSEEDIKHFQSLISSLLYVQIGTRPDISFAVLHLVQYASNLSNQHLRLAKHILSYLSGTIDT